MQLNHTKRCRKSSSFLSLLHCLSGCHFLGSHFWLAMSAGRCESPKSRKSIVRFCKPTCKNAWIWGEINVKFLILRHKTYIVHKCLSLCRNPNCKSTPRVQARLVCGTPCWLPMTKLERKRIDVQSEKYARTMEMHWRSTSTLQRCIFNIIILQQSYL